jgi:hypothetical protein
VHPDGEGADSDEHPGFEEPSGHDARVIGRPRADLESASSDLGLNFTAGPSDTPIMKIKLTRDSRKKAAEPADPFLGVKAFLAASRAAAGEPLGESAIRARIQQDPLGALRERLAAG